MDFTLYCDSLVNPIVVDRAPRLSWKIGGDPASVTTGVTDGFIQTSYMIRVATCREKLADADVWCSGEVFSDQSVDIELPAELKSSTRYWWNVAVTDAAGTMHISEPDWFETGLLNQEDWRAEWISAGSRYITNWAMQYRREFLVCSEVAKAKVYISGLGFYELTINGRKVGDHVLDPAITEFPQKIFYVGYDVTDRLQRGGNALGVVLGDGWYHQSQLMEGGGIYGDPCLLLQLEITYKSGVKQYVVSDGGWKTFYSPITMNNIYVGETYDGRMEQPGWDLYGYHENGWFQAVPDNAPKGKLVPQLIPPIRVTQELKPAAVTMPQEGVFVFDMGKNFAGYVRLKVFGTPGNEVVMRFGEAVTQDGMVDVDSSGVFHIRGVQTLRYIFGKTGEIVWEPRFAYFGFRYVELTGAHANVTAETLTGLKVHTDLAPKADFVCAMPILNQMQELFRNTFTSNIHGIPTDCPAREKCGWTGDANIIADTSMVMWDAQLFWDKYIDDIVTAHREHGVYNNVVPGKRGCLDTVPAWGTAILTIPWNCYQAYGCRSVLEKYYDEMAAYTAYMQANTTGYIYNDHPYKLADWCAPYGYDPAQQYFETSTAYYYYGLCIMAQTAGVLGRKEEEKHYADLAEKVKEVFLAKYYDAENHCYGTQTLTSFCAEIGLYPEGEKAAMAAWCARDIVNHDYHVTCGHLGLRYIYKFMSEFGYYEVLEKTLNSRTYPSFGAQIEMGATTLWESFTLSTHRQSLNHPFKGAFSLWLYEDVLGIKKTSPGYKTFTIKPVVTPIVPWAKGEVQTVYGKIAVDYKVGSHFLVTVPANTTAEVYVPQEDGSFLRHTLKSGFYSL